MHSDCSNPSIQYAFLLSSEGKLFACDQSSRDFLGSIDLGIFYAQIESIKINMAITNTTIMINSTSYNLRLVPMSVDYFTDPSTTHTASNVPTFKYIVVLQNQASFSSIYQTLNQMHLVTDKSSGEDMFKHEKKMYELLEQQNCGIFVTNTRGVVVFANSEYEKSTGLLLSDIIGKKLSDLKQLGILDPLITPTILETGEVLTTTQRLGKDKRAIISGTPIYDGNGKTIIIMTCVNIVDKITPCDHPKQFYDPKNINVEINRRHQTHSIDIIAESNVMETIVQDAVKIAHHNVTVLILGESGVGKEVISTIIHTASPRNKEQFVKINCCAITPSLLESELFGYEPGSFTGALSKGKAGLFEVANNGTLLLDEIGDMPLELQSKLLRVLQNKEIYRVGGISPIKVDVRIIAATNKDPEVLVSQGKLRQDLYYRLNAVSLDIPPLRDRREDIKPLLLHFGYFFNKKYHTDKAFSPELLEVLENYSWPGNVRELQNVVERLTVLCLEHILLPEHFYSKYKSGGVKVASDEGIFIDKIMPLNDAVAITERHLVKKAMEICKNTRSAADLLSVSQSTIMRKIKEYSIDVKNFK